MGISFSSKGDWKKTEKWLKKNENLQVRAILEEYANIGLEALRNATPIKTGATRDAWYYEIDTNTPGRSIISWCNGNVNNGANIAVLIQYGHGTGTGAYIQGVDYINPVIKPIFDSLSDKLYKEVTTAYGN